MEIKEQNIKPKAHKDQGTAKQLLYSVLVVIILILAGWVRFYGLEWDQGTHLHPDERYLTMVASAIRFPDEFQKSVGSENCPYFLLCPQLYWNTSQSTLNPANYDQYASYVYGTLPLFFTRAAGRFMDQACVNEITKPLSVFLARGLRHIFMGTNELCNVGQYTGYGGIHLVGRILSASADLMTLLGLMFLARLLYGDRTAIISGLLYAFTVLPIQHAHFFVVDSFAAVFVIWTLMFCAYAYVKKKPAILIVAGAFTGLAVASKISVWPLAGVVGITGLLLILHSSKDIRFTFTTEQLLITLSLLFSGILAAIMFRVGQPYAFEGPGFFDVGLNPKWLATMKEIRELVSGMRDVPFGHQWTNRKPVIFPIKNMIVWGMGLPLGISAWLGWGAMGWRIWKSSKYRHAIPWVWGTLFFAYQSTQWVKSMRYLLPIYPVFVLMAGWFLVNYVLKERKQSTRRIVKHLSRAGYYLVVCGTFLWGCAFLQIYTKPLTRVSASRWIYKNIPTAVTLHTDSGDIQVPVRPSTIIYKDIPTTIRIPNQVSNKVINSITINKYKLLSPESGFMQIEVNGETAAAPLPYSEDDSSSVDLEFIQPVTLKPNQQYDMVFYLELGDAVELASSIIANEHWDDPLPQRLDGKDPFWNWYQSLSSSPTTQMNNYDNDNVEKRTNLIAWLDEADYIVLSSNRLYGSIPRLPLRYPFTTQYYSALFSGDLGFDLLAEFVSYPQLGDFQFPDQEIPFPVSDAPYSDAAPCSINITPAEEAFSVYDHPTVYIFAKNSTYSSASVAAALPSSLLDNVQWMTPLEATRGRPSNTPSLIFDNKTRLEQENGGTWSRIFNRSAIHNRFPMLSVVLWWFLITILGWIVFPWLFMIFPNLHYRGYGVSKTAGLLLWSYIVWILASLRIAQFTRLTLWVIFALISVVVFFITRKKHTQILEYIRTDWRYLLRLEIIFLVLYSVWVLVRYLNPDLWHPVTGGEKPMDFAYLNAIVKSTWFPPYDPWFAGGKLNYYYFGFVMVASLIKATGTLPNIAYNLAVPTFFALTGLGAYTVASNLSGTQRKKGNRVGILAILFVVVFGNLGEARLLFKGYETVGNIQFDSLIPGYQAVVSALVGLWKVVVNKVPLGFRPEWWYWDATRVIPFKPGEVGAINEFPAFTFLYADLHAHMMAFPLTLVALTVMVQLAISSIPQEISPGGRLSKYLKSAFPQPLSSLLFAGLVLGALRATNTWDYPTYLALVCLGSLFPLVSQLRRGRPGISEGGSQFNLRYLRILTPIAIFLIAEMLFQPFTRNYAVAYSSFEAWEGSRTPLGIYFIMYGLFLFPIITAAIFRSGHLVASELERKGRYPHHIIIPFTILAILLIFISVFLFDVPIAWIAIPLGLTALAFLLSAKVSTRRQIMWLSVGTTLFLSLGVEVLVLKGDIGRMNTVFKFYLQVWMLLGLCASVFVERILHHSLTSVKSPSWLKDNTYHALVDIVSVAVAILLFGAGLYPALAIPAKARDRWATSAPKTLDGAAFIPYVTQEEHGSRMSLASDVAVIKWLQDNVEGSPTIMEAQAEREYLWGARISIHTGLPAVAAWRWHQVQQRMVMPPGTVEARQLAVRLFYNTSNPQQAVDILREYGVEYVILTPYERAYMVPDGYAKFSMMENDGFLVKVFESGESAIYQVIHQ